MTSRVLGRKRATEHHNNSKGLNKFFWLAGILPYIFLEISGPEAHIKKSFTTKILRL